MSSSYSTAGGSDTVIVGFPAGALPFTLFNMAMLDAVAV